LTKLCGYLSKACLDPQGLRCRVDAVRGVSPAGQCRNLGPIVNELVPNAAKHAFPNWSDGLVTAVLRRHDSVSKVVVADDAYG
jgi:two-component sensor histidine kinase